MHLAQQPTSGCRKQHNPVCQSAFANSKSTLLLLPPQPFPLPIAVVAPVSGLALPPAAARLPFSTCCLSVAEDGSVSLVCLARRQACRTFRTLQPTAAPPLQVAWSYTRWVVRQVARRLHGLGVCVYMC
jgi:hypothetical protein